MFFFTQKAERDRVLRRATLNRLEQSAYAFAMRDCVAPLELEILYAGFLYTFRSSGAADKLLVVIICRSGGALDHRPSYDNRFS
jgi:hypothetical protein